MPATKEGCNAPNNKKRRSVKLPVLGDTASSHLTIAPSRTSLWRAAALICLNVLMIAHIVHWKIAGETISPIEPSEAMYTLQNGAINAGFIFFILAIAATLIFGRFVCGWGCHVLALQDLCAWMLKKVGLRPRPFRSRLLIYIPLVVALYMFVWPTVSRLISRPQGEPLFPAFSNHLITTDFWATFPPVWIAIPFLFICGFVTVYFLGSKGFCTYACPYGGFFALADKVAPGRIRVTDACNGCGHCTAVCTSNVTVHAEVRDHGMVVDPGCMKCMDCVSVCPNDALYFGFGRPSAVVKKTTNTNYPLSWSEEIFGVFVFFVSFMAVWNVYQIVPMLMALGIASITTFLALRLVRLTSEGDLAFYRWNLRSENNVSTAGWLFGAFALIWIGVVVHSGAVRYFDAAGSRSFEAVALPDELALANGKPQTWLSKAELTTVAEGRYYLETAENIGLFTNVYSLQKRAWLEYLSGNAGEALDLLARAADRQEGQNRAISLYYRGAILNRLGRPEEALEALDAAIATRSDLTAAIEESGESFWRSGKRDEAFVTWQEAAGRDPRSPLANYLLAGAASFFGRTDDATAYLKLARQNTPPDALFYWMTAVRLQNLGMNALAEEQFSRAIQLDPRLRSRRVIEMVPAAPFQ